MRFVLLCALAIAALPSAAAAVTQVASPATFAAADIGVKVNRLYNGFVDETLTSGLSSRTVFQLTAIGNGGRNWDFAYAVQNRFTAPVTAARVSIFGFDVDGITASNNTLALQAASATGVYDTVARNGNVPQIGPTLDVCFRAGGGGGGCASGGGGGNSTAGSFIGGTFRLTFASAVQRVILDNFFVRYQSVNSAVLNGASGVGVDTMLWSPAVPEPATWAQMIAGFGLLGLAMRRRRALAATQSA